MSDLIQRLRDAGLALPGSRECGLEGNVCDEAADTIKRLTAERDAARAGERERCAKLCDKISTKMDGQCPGSHVGYWPANVGHAIAAAIRASEGQ